MPDLAFDDPRLSALYDRRNGGRGPDDDFYVGLLRSAGSALDVGCGTGWVLQLARADGHPGRLVGIDPSASMLARATRTDIDWVHGYLPGAGFEDEFDLVTMNGHAFQVLQTDEAVAEVLAAVATALRPGGRFAFESRNPLVRAWERWTPDTGQDVVDDDGNPVHVRHEVVSVDGDLVTFTETFGSPAWDPPQRVSTSTLRFAPAGHIDHLLARAGFTVDERYGDWDRSPFTPASREIITVASHPVGGRSAP